MTQKDLVEIAREYFEKSTLFAAKKVICSYLPFFLTPPLSSLLDKFLAFFISKIADVLETAAFFVYTDLRVSQEGKAFVNAKLAYKNAQTDEEKKKYEAQIISALDALVSLR